MELNDDEFVEIGFMNITIKAANTLAEITNKQYDNYVKKINIMCLEAANNGKMKLYLQESQFNAIGFVPNVNNFNTLSLFLKNEGYDVLTNIDHESIRITWPIVAKKEDQDEKEIQKLIKKYSAKEKDVVDVIEFIKDKLLECQNAIGRENKESVALQIYCTIANFAKIAPHKVDRITKNPRFMNTLYKKLDEFLNDGLTWATDMKIELNKHGIKRTD